MKRSGWRKNIWRLHVFVNTTSSWNNKKRREDTVVLAELKRLMCNLFFFSLTGSTWEDSSSPPISSKHQLWQLEAERSPCMCVCVLPCGWACTVRTFVVAILIISCSFLCNYLKIIQRGFASICTPNYSGCDFDLTVVLRVVTSWLKWCVVIEIALYVCDNVQNSKLFKSYL